MMQVANYKTIGMQRDSSESSFDSKLAFENMNMRITARDSNTLLSLSNERGNLGMTLVDDESVSTIIEGYPIGYAVLDSELILFTTLNLTESTSYSTDRIYKITTSSVANTLVVKKLFEGTLNFDVTHPIEAIPFHENENIKKVYWVDGKNQPRFINIVLEGTSYGNDSFDFSPNMNLQETVTITKNTQSVGSFPAGTVQYIFTYFNKNGVETRPFYVSPQYYTSFETKAGSPEAVLSNSFDIQIQNPDTLFDYMRVYSVIRTSINGTPVTTKVQDINVQENMYFIHLVDTNTLNESVPTNQPLTTGSERIVAETLAQKDNTLFLGNIELTTPTIGNKGVTFNGEITFSEKELFTEDADTKDYGYAPYTLDKNQSQITSFKGGEYYRFGIQAQHESGKWSEVVWIKDVQNTLYPQTIPQYRVVQHTTLSDASETNDEIYIHTASPSNITQYLRNDQPVSALSTFIAEPWVYDDTAKIIGSFIVSTRVNGVITSRQIQNGYVAIAIVDDTSLEVELVGDNIIRMVCNSMNTTFHNIATVTYESVIDTVKVFGSQAAMSLTLGGTETLQNLGYKKIRGVVVYPKVNERRVIAQGFLNPTLYNVEDRYNNTPGIIPSWFLRPMAPVEISSLNQTNAYLTGNIAEFRHNFCLPYPTQANCEINDYNPLGPLQQPFVDSSNPNADTGTDIKSNYKNQFFIDGSFQDFYSPEFEFDTNLQAADSLNAKLQIIGLTQFTGFKGDIDLTTSTGPQDTAGGFIEPSHLGTYNYNINGYKQLCAAPVWKDSLRWVIHPWHPLQPIALTKGHLSTKRMSNFRYSGFNVYLDSASFWRPTAGISTVKVVLNDEKLYNIDSVDNLPQKSFYYKGSVEKAIIPNGGKSSVTNDYESNIIKEPGITGYSTLLNIKYKTVPHGVFGFNWSDQETMVIAPMLNNFNSSGFRSYKKRLFWDDTREIYTSQDRINVRLGGSNVPYGGVWIAELYRDIDENLLFGGTSKNALLNNEWYVAGEAIDITSATQYNIPLTIGDTFVQRYDCLRVYPDSISDAQTMTEVVSVLCETRINLDGRYDNNRNGTNILAITPSNYNVLNEVYNQKDNYFTYRTLDYDLLGVDKFANTLTWTPKKLSGEIIDAWTNLLINNTYDVNGEFGPIRALKIFNDSLYGFQDKALFGILYDSRVQVSASDGIPIEISNSGKMDGVKYISTNSGTKNKFSIETTPFGMYYIDEINKSINIFNGQISSLSDKLGFHSWSNKSFTGLQKWSPYSYDNFTTHFDNINKDIYFINKTEALCYSELLGQFTSFFNYERVPYMFNIWDGLFSIKRDNVANKIEIWEQNKGNYNQFFGTYKPFYTTLLVNPNPQINKVFNTFEFRADTWETSDNWVTPDSMNTLRRVVDFTKLKVWDEYQIGEHPLTFNNGQISSLKQKFRAWRTPIPRVTSKNYTAAQGGMVKTPTITGLDRLRNNWAYMQLYSDGTHNYRTVLHDINIYYGM